MEPGKRGKRGPVAGVCLGGWTVPKSGDYAMFHLQELYDLIRRFPRANCEGRSKSRKSDYIQEGEGETSA